MSEISNSKSDNTKDVSYEIRTFFETERNAHNLNVRELGKLADVSYTVIYDLEKRNILPKIETLMKLADALGLTITAKRCHDECTQALSLIFYKDEGRGFNARKTRENTNLTPDEQLRKTLSQKGLYPDEIKEIESYIAFKLSQH